jgi:hypothetical protein
MATIINPIGNPMIPTKLMIAEIFSILEENRIYNNLVSFILTSLILMMLAKNRGGYCEKNNANVHFHMS